MPGRDVCERLYKQFLETRNLEPIHSAISVLEEIIQEYRDTERDTLQEFGCGPRLQQALEASRSAGLILAALQDLFCYAILDNAELKEMYATNQLVFQSL